MFEPLRRLLVRPLVTVWLASSPSSWRALPRPHGDPSAFAEGADPDRLLLIGSGISVGYGTDSHDSALAGQIARAVASRTGRGTSVDVLVTDDMNARDVRHALDRKTLLLVDAIVATPGGLETLFLHSARGWRREIESLLDYIRHHAPASLHVFVIAVPSLPQVVRMPRLPGLLAARTATRINAELALACEGRTNTVFVPFNPEVLPPGTGPAGRYRHWAELIAPLIAAELEPNAV